MTSSFDIAFTPAVKAIQTRRGSRKNYLKLEERGGWPTTISDELILAIAQADSFFLATANCEGQPYIQHRGGPPGFLRVLDDKTLGFADYSGNRQYITAGNLSENPKAYIFLMDYLSRQRFKIWGEAHIVESNTELIESLFPPGYRARPEHAVIFTITAWDTNCPSHIPQKIDAETFAEVTSDYEDKIKQLEAEIQQLRKEG